MTIIFALGFGAARSIPKLSLLLLIANSARYFLGSTINNHLDGRAGMLLWGIIYGPFLEPGIGTLLFRLQKLTNVL